MDSGSRGRLNVCSKHEEPHDEGWSGQDVLWTRVTFSRRTVARDRLSITGYFFRKQRNIKTAVRSLMLSVY